MKIDQDYLKKLLETCEAAPAPIFDIEELKAAGVDYDTDQFVFHMSAGDGHDTRSIQDYLGRRKIQHTVRHTELSPTKFKDLWRN